MQAYVKCELHVASQDEQDGGQIPKGGKNKGGEWKRKTTTQRSHDPDFADETMDFHGVSGAVPELSFVRYVEIFPFLPHRACVYPGVTMRRFTTVAILLRAQACRVQLPRKLS